MCAVEHPTLSLVRGLHQVFLLHRSTTVPSEATKNAKLATMTILQLILYNTYITVCLASLLCGSE